MNYYKKNLNKYYQSAIGNVEDEGNTTVDLQEIMDHDKEEIDREKGHRNLLNKTVQKTHITRKQTMKLR